jgi:hypothetical protein
MNARNPKHTASGSIEMEIDHPTYGWIPFAASPNDCEAHGRELYQRAIDGEFGTIELYVKPLALAQSEQTAIIEAVYQSANTAPITFQGWTFQTDAESVALMAQVASALPSGASITWYDMSNTGVMLSDTSFAELRGAILMRGQPLFAKKQQLKQQIRIASTITQVEAVVW